MTQENGLVSGFQDLTLEEIEEKVTDREEAAREANSNRMGTVGLAVAKTGIGAALVMDSIAHNVGFWRGDTNPDIITTAVSAAVLIWGLKDAGIVPYEFARARQLNTEVKLLRETLTRRYQQAINQLPDSSFRR